MALMAVLISTGARAQSRLDLTPVPPPPDVAAAPGDADRSATGLPFKILRAGTGDRHPSVNDRVSVHYTIWTADGTTIDASMQRGQPAVWLVADQMPGVREALQLMVAGERRRVWVQENRAYERRPDRPAGPLVVDLDLLGIEPAAILPPLTREMAAAPPADAQRTPSGLAYLPLRPGTGPGHPLSHSRLTVHYNVWSSLGELVDSSVSRGAPEAIRVDTMIPGLIEGLPLIAEGGAMRFWIPEPLSFQTEPKQSLVVDVALLRIERPSGAPGTLTITSNLPSTYMVMRPDGTGFGWKGSHVFLGQEPGQYEVRLVDEPGYSASTTATPADMTLTPGGTLTIVITYTKR